MMKALSKKHPSIPSYLFGFGKACLHKKLTASLLSAMIMCSACSQTPEREVTSVPSHTKPLAHNQVALFNDEGSTYNPMTFVRAIKTHKDAYTLEFKNDEESYFTNFIITSDGVVAFDPLSDTVAKEYVKHIQRLAPNKPLIAIVYSHLHTDHIAGARILRAHFGKDVPIIAHKNVKKYFEYYQTPYIDLPTITIGNEGKTMTFGDKTVDFHYLGSAHTDSILVPVIKELRLAYVCDFANNDVVGWTTLPGIDLDELINMNKAVLALDVDTITFCHGQPDTKAAITRQLAYWNTLFTAVRQAIAQQKTEAQAVKSIKLDKFRYFANYDDWFEGNVKAVYRWLTQNE